jgi:hypothetical protein
VKVGNGLDRTMTARFPVVSVVVPTSAHWITDVSASSLLDRSWETSRDIVETIGAQEVQSTMHESSNGAINDLRLAEAWTNRSWLYVGLGIHAVTGRNVVASGQVFADTTDFSSFANSKTISYSGGAISGGVQVIHGHATVGLAYRKGGSMRARTNDTTFAEGDVPDHFGASVAYTGIRGTILAVRAAHDGWSSMSSMLASPSETAHDSWDLGAGAEVAGPRFANQALMLRAGFRTRTLPFEAMGRTVKEKSLSFGSGVNFGGGRMTADITGIRQFRDAGIPNVQERAWTLSLSLTARP